MKSKGKAGSKALRPFDIRAPADQSAPIVFTSPHSGAEYPPAFIAASRLDPRTLRRSEDAFVDELFAAAPALGVPLLAARFPRAFVDPNREPFELDPHMFFDALPSYVNDRSARVAAGLGTIARVVATGAEIYPDKLNFTEALQRIERYYRPFHAALARLIEETRQRFGLCILVDCHSMPSIGGPMDRDPGRSRVDFVLGDCNGQSCSPHLIGAVESHLEGLGFAVTRNMPYSGGFITRHYGRPDAGVEALQIEVNRGLYMDELLIERGPGLNGLQKSLTSLVETLAAYGRARSAA
jgi:N-formylglutamate amidohydrolase